MKGYTAGGPTSTAGPARFGTEVWPVLVYDEAMTLVSVQDLKAKLSAVVAAAEAGETIVITRHGKAVARLVPADPPHVHRGSRVGEPFPPSIAPGTGLGARAVEILLEDRADRW